MTGEGGARDYKRSLPHNTLHSTAEEQGLGEKKGMDTNYSNSLSVDYKIICHTRLYSVSTYHAEALASMSP